MAVCMARVCGVSMAGQCRGLDHVVSGTVTRPRRANTSWDFKLNEIQHPSPLPIFIPSMPITMVRTSHSLLGIALDIALVRFSGDSQSRNRFSPQESHSR